MAGSRRRLVVTGLAAASVAFAMIGAAFASAPLYRLFCEATGYGGTPGRSDGPELAAARDRVITIRFDANVAPSMPWRFKPERREMAVRVGESALAFYKAENLAASPVTGSATFNVTPAKAGAYFTKIDCFCFSEQTLAGGGAADMPVTFYVDPAILDDRNLDDVTTITLSYTFFRAPEGA
jgi:cytochrome c oxidase assembly protein subunit 11